MLTHQISAQSADDYFHGSAQFYVFGDKPKSRLELNTGLQKFPDDAKLMQMAKLLKDDENQEKQDQKDQQSKDDQKQSDQQKKQDQQKPDDKKDAKDKRDDQQKKQQDQKQKPDDQSKKQPSSSDQPKQSKEQNPQQQTGEGEPKPGQMSPQQARQLMDSQRGEEQMLRPVAPATEKPPVKNW